MSKGYGLLLLASLAMGVVGCSRERPGDYSDHHPSPRSYDPRDSGLQSRDVLEATDRLAMDLAGNRRLNESRTQWTLVVMEVQNRTTDRTLFNPDIFIERLRVKLSNEAQGRIQLVENRDWYRHIQGRELERPNDRFGQGGPGGFPAGTQPDYALYGKIMDMPNRGTNYYLLTFSITDLRSRQQVWNGMYEVRTAR